MSRWVWNTLAFRASQEGSFMGRMRLLSDQEEAAVGQGEAMAGLVARSGTPLFVSVINLW